MSEIPLGMHRARWGTDLDIILRFYRRKPRPKQVPRLIRRFGKEHFKIEKNTIFYKNREIVHDDKRRAEIIEKENLEESYGGARVLFHRLQKKYIGIPLRYIQSYLMESERRQLKQRKQSSKNHRSFIHEPRPGSLQMDLTFYHSAKFVVFGGIIYFSPTFFALILKAVANSFLASDSASLSLA